MRPEVAHQYGPPPGGGVGLIFAATRVPAVVPSVDHSAFPPVPSVAVKYSRRWYTVKPVGLPLFGIFVGGDVTGSGGGTTRPLLPGKAPLTRTVPFAVPPVFHSSDPRTPSSARK